MAIATLGTVVLDCPDTRRLAEFYAAVLGWTITEDSTERWTDVKGPDGQYVSFQHAPDFVPPQWPSAENGQQLHLDLNVPRERIDEAERQVVELGARLVEGDDGGKRNFRVYLDPAGHPFCLCY